ncbi:NTP/NDP exchange transporter [Salinisphaera sp. Q1T1-3]|uniref:NTP/NDP exchange transporter n=1 Tax=Salinisphaera sp. Q1T1-3 TaxID=2321229 RepID=UPI000E73F5D5|nr:MFS transporter [Salinisphaera sp. Q1T1-3]RJS94864.1 MFS transporter [Salinisphaera sp. Q1T1-3]
MTTRLYRLLQLEPGELGPVAGSFAYFFCLLAGYFVLRPVRDEMGIQGGVGDLAWVFTATFLVMLAIVPVFGWAVARFARRRLVAVSYGVSIGVIILFFGLMRADIAPAWVARAFFVWVSVFNLFVVSLFWSVMNDVFDRFQSLRLFGVISAGGSLGAIVGPAITAGLADTLGPVNLLPISVILLVAATAFALAVMSSATATGRDMPGNGTSQGNVWAGAMHVFRSPYLLAICVFIVMYASLSTFLYFEQAHIVKNAFASSAQRTQVFAGMDLATNTLTLLLQFFATARLVLWLGLPVALALIPLAVAAGFGLLGLAPTLVVLVVFQVVRRAGNYALTKPSREMLFGVVSREDKYKAKNFIDTVVYRFGDAASGWLYTGLGAIGLGLAGLAFAAIPLALIWAVFGIWLGRTRQRRAADTTFDDSAEQQGADT